MLKRDIIGFIHHQSIERTEVPHLMTAGYLNDTTLAITVFAPTNDAFVKRLPTLTRANGITVQELFSESKSAALQNMLQYHILNTVQKVICPPLSFPHHYPKANIQQDSSQTETFCPEQSVFEVYFFP